MHGSAYVNFEISVRYLVIIMYPAVGNIPEWRGGWGWRGMKMVFKNVGLADDVTN